MSAQGGTLGRLGTVHVPIWPVAVLLAAAIAGAIALSVSMRDDVQVTGVSDTAIWDAQADAYVDSLEAAAVLPSTNAAIWDAQADAYVDSLEAAAVLPSTAAAIWRAQADAYVDSMVAAAGGGQKAGGHRPIEVNGKICGQCR
jgi:hypothetical protein